MTDVKLLNSKTSWFGIQGNINYDDTERIRGQIGGQDPFTQIKDIKIKKLKVYSDKDRVYSIKHYYQVITNDGKVWEADGYPSTGFDGSPGDVSETIEFPQNDYLIRVRGGAGDLIDWLQFQHLDGSWSKVYGSVGKTGTAFDTERPVGAICYSSISVWKSAISWYHNTLDVNALSNPSTEAEKSKKVEKATKAQLHEARKKLIDNGIPIVIIGEILLHLNYFGIKPEYDKTDLEIALINEIISAWNDKGYNKDNILKLINTNIGELDAVLGRVKDIKTNGTSAGGISAITANAYFTSTRGSEFLKIWEQEAMATEAELEQVKKDKTALEAVKAAAEKATAEANAAKEAAEKAKAAAEQAKAMAEQAQATAAAELKKWTEAFPADKYPKGAEDIKDQIKDYIKPDDKTKLQEAAKNAGFGFTQADVDSAVQAEQKKKESFVDPKDKTALEAEAKKQGMFSKGDYEGVVKEKDDWKKKYDDSEKGKDAFKKYIQGRLDEKDKEIKDLKEKLQKVAEKLGTASTDPNLTQKVDDLIKEKGGLNDQIKQKNTEIDQLKKRVGELEAQKPAPIVPTPEKPGKDTAVLQAQKQVKEDELQKVLNGLKTKLGSDYPEVGINELLQAESKLVRAGRSESDTQSDEYREWKAKADDLVGGGYLTQVEVKKNFWSSSRDN
ncbi:MAG: hypothetical protein I3273_05655 [Candidatus Moeniiplasma glomeromycotorum]|nr:hypothetical protein [Candidatus Moeniiplasma glomeromycotorum]MCE8168054.1 hypothetical protein [Candidatus Moeniiplasma glomeromycotorum]MCE8169571.1 hypothetical protein [Candidatus Moeniiplasma glomeromycotorum]